MNKYPTPNAWIAQAPLYVPGSHTIDGHDDIAVLSANENPFGPADAVKEHLQSAAQNLHRYPEGTAHALRGALADIHGLAAERIIIGAGSDEIISALMRVYAGPGTSVVYTQHGFLMYKIAATNVGATPVCALEVDRKLSVDNILRIIDETTRVVCIANPNNPTGHYLNKDAVTYLIENIPAHCVVLLDAAYA
ncbi:MAG: aminotransferase class I/II-fold pyridoxal phosphate-dependent enzyme, partial [Pseudomonadota bacterium]